jgi:hypothetical protein
MFGLDKYDSLFVAWSFVYHLCLIAIFAVRKTNFDLIARYGWIFYALCVPALIVSVILLRGGKPWSFWLAGFLFVLWGILGYTVEYVFKIPWRSPIVWPVLIPYVLLYLGTTMFYWWPVGLLSRPLWYIYAVLFALSTYLNVTSH